MSLAERIWPAAAFAMGLLMMVGIAAAGVLERVVQEKAIRIAYREDAPPFSFKDKIGEPAGFMVDLCRAVAKKVAEERNLPSLSVVYVPVTAATGSMREHRKKPTFSANRRASPCPDANWSTSRFRLSSTAPA